MNREHVTLDVLLVLAGHLTGHEHQLHEALRRIIAVGDDLTGALAGTAQFHDEREAFMKAIGLAERLLEGGAA